MLIDQICQWARKTPTKNAFITNDIEVTYSSFWLSIQRAILFFKKKDLPERVVVAIIHQDLAASWTIGISLRALGLDTIAIKNLSQIQTLQIQRLNCVVIGVSEAIEEYKRGNLPCSVNTIILQGSFLEQEDGEFGKFDCLDRQRSVGGHILYTSGTTGDYKKLLFDGSKEDSRNNERAKALEISEYSVCNSIHFALWTGAGFKQPSATWHVGGTVVFDQRPQFLKDLFNHGVTYVGLLPPEYKLLLELHMGCGFVTHAKLNCSSGFLPLSVARRVVQQISRFLEISYSATELVRPPMKALFFDDDDLYWLHPDKNSQIEIVDENGEPCGKGEEGFVRVRITDIDAQCYLDDEEATAKVFRDGYFYPGDMGVQRLNGRIRVLGRVSDVINIQGQKRAVAPYEADLQRYLNVDEICLFSHQNAIGQDELIIAIEARTEVNRDKLEAVTKAFAGFESTRVVYFDQFPRTQTGTRKVRRLALKNQIRDRQRAP